MLKNVLNFVFCRSVLDIFDNLLVDYNFMILNKYKKMIYVLVQCIGEIKCLYFEYKIFVIING